MGKDLILIGVLVSDVLHELETARSQSQISRGESERLRQQIVDDGSWVQSRRCHEHGYEL